MSDQEPGSDSLQNFEAAPMVRSWSVSRHRIIPTPGPGNPRSGFVHGQPSVSTDGAAHKALRSSSGFRAAMNGAPMGCPALASCLPRCQRQIQVGLRPPPIVAPHDRRVGAEDRARGGRRRRAAPQRLVAGRARLLERLHGGPFDDQPLLVALHERRKALHIPRIGRDRRGLLSGEHSIGEVSLQRFVG